MEKLLTLGPDNLLSSVYPGLDEANTPLWREGRNVVFREMGIKKIKGVSEVIAAYVAANPVKALLQGFAAGKPRLFVGTQTGVDMLEKDVGGTTSINLGAWPTAANYVNLENWGNWVIANNGIDPVRVWKNSGPGGMVPLASTPFTRAKIIKRKHVYLLAFNTSNGENMIEWSHTSDIENWTIASNTEAGNYPVRDLESGITAVTDLGDRLGVYSQSSLVLGNFIGRPNIFSWRRVLEGIGAVSPKSVVAQGPFNYGLSTNGIFKTDGNSYTWIDDPAAQRWVLDNVGWETPDEIFGWHDDYLRVIHWNFLDRFSQPKSISFHYDGGQFVTGDMALTAATPRASWLYPIVAGTDRKPGFWQQGATINGTASAFSLRTKPLDFGARDRAKILQLIRVDGNWSIGTRLRVGAVADPEGDPEWFHDANLVRENYFENEREDCYFVMELSGNVDCHISGIEFFGVPGGVLL